MMNEEELISAYVDGQMSDAERTAFEARLAQDAALRRRVLVTRLLVREAGKLPTVALPRNFILPLDAGRARPQAERPQASFPRWIFRFGSVAATVVFAALVALEVLQPAAPAAQPEMAIPMSAAAVPEASQPTVVPAQPAPAARDALGAAEASPAQAEAMSPNGAASGSPTALPTGEPAFLPQDALQATQPEATDASPPSMASPLAPITLQRLLAAVALIAAAALGVLGWGRRG